MYDIKPPVYKKPQVISQKYLRIKDNLSFGKSGKRKKKASTILN